MSTPHTPKPAEEREALVARLRLRYPSPEVNGRYVHNELEQQAADTIESLAAEVAALQAENGELRDKLAVANELIRDIAGRSTEAAVTKQIDAIRDAMREGNAPEAMQNLVNAFATTTALSVAAHRWAVLEHERADTFEAERDEALKTVEELRATVGELREALEAAGSFFSDVVEWDKATGGAASLDLRVVCMEEEWTELHEAMESGDVAQVAKEAADVVWTVLALAWGYDVPFDAVWTEVVRSNFSKVGPNGETHRRADGKIVKPPNYSPPDLSFVAPRVPGAEGS